MGFRVMGVYSGGQTTPHIFNFLTGKLWDPEKFCMWTSVNVSPPFIDDK